jgi:hypothetical protein
VPIKKVLLSKIRPTSPPPAPKIPLQVKAAEQQNEDRKQNGLTSKSVSTSQKKSSIKSKAILKSSPEQRLAYVKTILDGTANDSNPTLNGQILASIKSGWLQQCLKDENIAIKLLSTHFTKILEKKFFTPQEIATILEKYSKAEGFLATVFPENDEKSKEKLSNIINNSQARVEIKGNKIFEAFIKSRGISIPTLPPRLTEESIKSLLSPQVLIATSSPQTEAVASDLPITPAVTTSQVEKNSLDPDKPFGSTKDLSDLFSEFKENTNVINGKNELISNLTTIIHTKINTPPELNFHVRKVIAGYFLSQYETQPKKSSSIFTFFKSPKAIEKAIQFVFDKNTMSNLRSQEDSSIIFKKYEETFKNAYSEYLKDNNSIFISEASTNERVAQTVPETSGPRMQA